MNFLNIKEFKHRHNFIQSIIINTSEQLTMNWMVAGRIELLFRKIGVIAVKLPMTWSLRKKQAAH